MIAFPRYIRWAWRAACLFPRVLDRAAPRQVRERLLPHRRAGDRVAARSARPVRSAASVAARLAERKRPFSMLRLTGARLGMLRRVVALESAVPLLVVAAGSIGVGLGASAMFVSAQLQHPLVVPGAAYYLTGAGIAASLGVIAAKLPLLRRITGPEVARNE